MLAEGEILEYERLSRECQGANDPKGPPEKQRHSGRMRTHVGDGKRALARPAKCHPAVEAAKPA